MIDFVAIKSWVMSFGPAAPIVFVMAYAAANILFLPTVPFSVLAGAIFGPWWGFFLATLSANLGANGSFLLGRYFGQGRVVKWLHARLPKLEAPLEKNAFEWTVGLRLVPVAPFFAINYGAGISPMPWPDFALGSLVGMIPWTFVYVSLGSVAGEAAMGTSLGDSRIWRNPTLWGLIVGVLVVVFLLKRFRPR